MGGISTICATSVLRNDRKWNVFQCIPKYKGNFNFASKYIGTMNTHNFNLSTPLNVAILDYFLVIHLTSFPITNLIAVNPFSQKDHSYIFPSFDSFIHLFFLHLRVYIYIYIYVCVCVCVYIVCLFIDSLFLRKDIFNANYVNARLFHLGDLGWGGSHGSGAPIRLRSDESRPE